MTRLNCSSLIRSSSVSSVMPALATSTSTGPELGLDRGERGVDRGGSVTSHVHAEQPVGRAGAAVGHRDPVALRGERLRDGQADPAVAAGDQHGPRHVVPFLDVLADCTAVGCTETRCY